MKLSILVLIIYQQFSDISSALKLPHQNVPTKNEYGSVSLANAVHQLLAIKNAQAKLDKHGNEQKARPVIKNTIPEPPVASTTELYIDDTTFIIQQDDKPRGEAALDLSKKEPSVVVPSQTKVFAEKNAGNKIYKIAFPTLTGTKNDPNGHEENIKENKGKKATELKLQHSSIQTSPKNMSKENKHHIIHKSQSGHQIIPELVVNPSPDIDETNPIIVNKNIANNDASKSLAPAIKISLAENSKMVPNEFTPQEKALSRAENSIPKHFKQLNLSKTSANDHQPRPSNKNPKSPTPPHIHLDNSQMHEVELSNPQTEFSQENEDVMEDSSNEGTGSVNPTNGEEASIEEPQNEEVGMEDLENIEDPQNNEAHIEDPEIDAEGKQVSHNIESEIEEIESKKVTGTGPESTNTGTEDVQLTESNIEYPQNKEIDRKYLELEGSGTQDQHKQETGKKALQSKETEMAHHPNKQTGMEGHHYKKTGIEDLATKPEAQTLEENENKETNVVSTNVKINSDKIGSTKDVNKDKSNPKLSSAEIHKIAQNHSKNKKRKSYHQKVIEKYHPIKVKSKNEHPTDIKVVDSADDETNPFETSHQEIKPAVDDSQLKVDSKPPNVSQQKQEPQPLNDNLQQITASKSSDGTLQKNAEVKKSESDLQGVPEEEQLHSNDKTESVQILHKKIETVAGEKVSKSENVEDKKKDNKAVLTYLNHERQVKENKKLTSSNYIIAVTMILIISTILFTIVGVYYRQIRIDRQKYIGRMLLETEEEEEDMHLFNSQTYNDDNDRGYESWKTIR